MSADHLEILNHMLSKPEKQNKQYKYLVFFSMFCMMIMLCKSMFSYRLVELGGFTLQAGQLVAPLWFTTSDIITEIYGYKIAKQILSAGMLCQIIFSAICMMLIHLPHPSFWHNEAAYEVVLGDMWRISFAVLFAFFISGIINIKLMDHWKLLMRRKHFWLRSIGASGISELLYSVLATLIIQYGKLGWSAIASIILASAALKIIYSVVLAFPAQIIAFLVTRYEERSHVKTIKTFNRG
ncbi:MAG: queuosine precursor transporter [Gammaproteobacteria bacterium]